MKVQIREFTLETDVGDIVVASIYGNHYGVTLSVASAEGAGIQLSFDWPEWIELCRLVAQMQKREVNAQK